MPGRRPICGAPCWRNGLAYFATTWMLSPHSGEQDVYRTRTSADGVQATLPRANNGTYAPDAQDLNRVRRGVGTLRVNNIYGAIQGEGVNMGVPVVILRLQGCSVGCLLCDTRETWETRSAGRG